MAVDDRPDRKVTAWRLLVTAVGIHVIDEALTGFLSFYNPLVLQLRQRLGFFPAPAFSFPDWIGGLALAVVTGFAITRLVARSGRVIRIVCGVLLVLMIGNACGDMLGSIYFERILPGFWSSPFLLAASLWMLVQVRGDWTVRPRLI